MYFGDHLPPHFHPEYGEFTAQFFIKDFGILEGYLPSKAIGLVVEWASMHQKELMKNWENLSENGNGTFVKIEPLK
jgi:hypothetical protein